MRESYCERAGRLIYYLLTAAIIYVLIKYVSFLLLPFLIGIALSEAVMPVAKGSSRFFGVSQRVTGAVALFLFLSVLFLLVYAAGQRLFLECVKVAELLSSGESAESVENVIDNLSGIAASLSERFPFVRGERTDEMIHTLFFEALSFLRSHVTAFLSKVISAGAYMIVIPVVTVLSAIYFTVDHDRIWGYWNEKLKGKWGEDYLRVKDRVKRSALRYLRAYAILFLITFFEVLTGFLFLDAPYVLILSLTVAAVDILPVLGAGTILVPWGIFALVTGDVRLGTGLLILYGIITIVRQIVEPHVMAGCLGIHPLASLFFAFAGFYLFGVAGMLLAPFGAAVIPMIFDKRSGDDSIR